MSMTGLQCEYCGYNVTVSGDGYNDPYVHECHPDCKGEDTLICGWCDINEYQATEYKMFIRFDTDVFCPPCFREMLKDNLTIERIN